MTLAGVKRRTRRRRRRTRKARLSPYKSFVSWRGKTLQERGGKRDCGTQTRKRVLYLLLTKEQRLVVLIMLTPMMTEKREKKIAFVLLRFRRPGFRVPKRKPPVKSGGPEFELVSGEGRGKGRGRRRRTARRRGRTSSSSTPPPQTT